MSAPSRMHALAVCLALAVALAARAEPAADDRSGGPTAERGNPLWAVPLNTLAATQARPLFSASRRPPAPPVPDAPPPPPADTTPPPAAPPPPSLALVGTIMSPRGGVALVRNVATQAVTQVRIGEGESGWRLRSVGVRSVVVEIGDQAVTLDFPTPGQRIEEQGSPRIQLSEGRRDRH